MEQAIPNHTHKRSSFAFSSYVRLFPDWPIKSESSKIGIIEPISKHQIAVIPLASHFFMLSDEYILNSQNNIIKVTAIKTIETEISKGLWLTTNLDTNWIGKHRLVKKMFSVQLIKFTIKLIIVDITMNNNKSKWIFLPT